MADTLTHLITTALSRAAAHPHGLPLFPSRQGEGSLFPNSKAGRTAAQKCLAEGWLQPVSPTNPAAAPAHRYILSESGWQRLREEAQPKQVLEDFLRVVEKRTALVGEWLNVAQQLHEELQQLRQALSRWIAAGAPLALTPDLSNSGSSVRPLGPSASEGGRPEQTTVAEAILHTLAEWSRQGGADCPLPELFRAVCQRCPVSLGSFHDALRSLHARQALALHPWTGPLYAVPEPAYAMLAGHGVAYYASLPQRTNAAASCPGAAHPAGPASTAWTTAAAPTPLTPTLASAWTLPENPS